MTSSIVSLCFIIIGIIVSLSGFFHTGKNINFINPTKELITKYLIQIRTRNLTAGCLYIILGILNMKSLINSSFFAILSSLILIYIIITRKNIINKYKIN